MCAVCVCTYGGGGGGRLLNIMYEHLQYREMTDLVAVVQKLVELTLALALISNLLTS